MVCRVTCRLTLTLRGICIRQLIVLLVLCLYSYSVSTEAHGVPRDFDVIYVDSCVICVMKQVNSATVPGQDLFKHANVQPDLLQHTKEFTQELIKVGYRCTCAGSRVYERMIHSGGREI